METCPFRVWLSCVSHCRDSLVCPVVCCDGGFDSFADPASCLLLGVRRGLVVSPPLFGGVDDAFSMWCNQSVSFGFDVDLWLLRWFAFGKPALSLHTLSFPVRRIRPAHQGEAGGACTGIDHNTMDMLMHLELFWPNPSASSQLVLSKLLSPGRMLCGPVCNSDSKASSRACRLLVTNAQREVWERVQRPLWRTRCDRQTLVATRRGSPRHRFGSRPYYLSYLITFPRVALRFVSLYGLIVFWVRKLPR